MGSMLAGFWDSPLVAQIAFPARPATAGDGCAGGMTDGSVDVGGGGSNAYRLCAGLPEAKRRAVCVYFHGNAEICTDICHGISDFYDAGVAVLSVDYRGYAWSKGQPKMSTMCPDAEKVHAEIPAILAKAGLAGLPIVLFGRSLGATCAVHLATTFPGDYAGVRAPLALASDSSAPCPALPTRPPAGCSRRSAAAARAESCASLRGVGAQVVLESGLQSVKDLPMLAPLSMMIPGADQMLPMLPEPLGTLEKMSKMTLPILFIHAEADEIVPLAQATRAHAAAPSASKTFEKVGGGAGHNDLTARASQQYFGAVKRFLDSLTGGGLSADDVAGLSVKALKAELKQRGVAHEHCVEKVRKRTFCAIYI